MHLFTCLAKSLRFSIRLIFFIFFLCFSFCVCVRFFLFFYVSTVMCRRAYFSASIFPFYYDFVHRTWCVRVCVHVRIVRSAQLRHCLFCLCVSLLFLFLFLSWTPKRLYWVWIVDILCVYLCFIWCEMTNSSNLLLYFSVAYFSPSLANQIPAISYQRFFFARISAFQFSVLMDSDFHLGTFVKI